jgi:TATA-box binding protein (TBP) (component of TFIID and TFIIIB)
MLVTAPTVCNVKISFAAPSITVSDLAFLKQTAHKVTQFYYVVKKQFTFTVYFRSKIINVTGIRCFDQVLSSIHTFKELITNQSLVCENIKIDNSTAFGRYLRIVDFHKLQKCLPPGYNIKIPPIFPGAFIELRNKKKILFFKSGKYISVGCKSRAELKSSFEELKAVCINYNRHEQSLCTSR